MNPDFRLIGCWGHIATDCRHRGIPLAIAARAATWCSDRLRRAAGVVADTVSFRVRRQGRCGADTVRYLEQLLGALQLRETVRSEWSDAEVQPLGYVVGRLGNRKGVVDPHCAK